MKGFEEVKEIPAIPFPDHSQGIISSVSFGASEESGTIPRELRLSLCHTTSGTKSPGVRSPCRPQLPQAPVECQGSCPGGNFWFKNFHFSPGRNDLSTTRTLNITRSNPAPPILHIKHRICNVIYAVIDIISYLCDLNIISYVLDIYLYKLLYFI